MISATLGPPPAVAGPVGPAEPAAEGVGPDAADSPEGGFSAALRDAASPSEPTARDEAQTTTAAGPGDGKLQNRTAADAGGQEQQATAGAAQAGAAVATALVTAMAPTVAGQPAVAVPSASAAPVVIEVTGASAVTAAALTAATAAAEGTAATMPQVPAAAAAPQTAGPAVPLTAPPPPAATAQQPALAPAATVPTDATQAATAAAAPTVAAPDAAIAASAAQAGQATAEGDPAAGPRPAATVTLTLSPPQLDGGTGAQGQPGSTQGGAGKDAGNPAQNTPAPAAADPKPAAPAPAPAASTPMDPTLLGGPQGPGQAAGPSGAHGASHTSPGAVHAAELARELGHRVHMAVREGGREIMLSMRPPELGHVVVRVVMHDGVMQAHVMADRPEAARMLEQALPHLAEALSERGYTLSGMDVAYHHEAHERPATAMDGRRGPRGLGSEPGDDEPQPTAAGAADIRIDAGPGQLDLLA